MHQSFETAIWKTGFHTRTKSKTKANGERCMKPEHDSSAKICLGHVGMYAKNPAALAEFYRDVMGMQVTGGSDGNHPLGATAFLSGCPGKSPTRSRYSATPNFPIGPSKSNHLPH